MQVAGFILTGGRSSRMGTDKALLPWQRTTIVEHLFSVLGQFAEPVMLVGAPERYKHLSLPSLPDLRSGLGPLAGLETALSWTQAEWNIMLACDMPGIEPSLLGELCGRAAKSKKRAVVLRDADERVHPLCGGYRRECLKAVKIALDCGRLRARDLVSELEVEFLDVPSIVVNVNTPEEWSAASGYALSHGK